MDVSGFKDLGLETLKIVEKILTFASKKKVESEIASRLSGPRLSVTSQQPSTSQAKLETEESTSMKKEKVSPIKLRKVGPSEFKIEPKAEAAGRCNSQLWERQQRRDSSDDGDMEIEFRSSGVVETHGDLFEGNYCLVHKTTYLNIKGHRITLDHIAMNTLIQSYRGNRLLRLQDFEDLFNPGNDVRHCWLCNLTFDTFSKYQKHLKSVEHIDTLTLHCSASSTPKRGKVVDGAREATNGMASLSIKERKPTKRLARKAANDIVNIHDDLLHLSYCLVHQKTFKRTSQHKKSKDHMAIAALITGGLRKATLTVQNFIDIFNPAPDVSECPLCKKTFETYDLYRKHLKSVKHRVCVESFSANADQENPIDGTAFSNLDIDDEQTQKTAVHEDCNNTLDFSLD